MGEHSFESLVLRSMENQRNQAMNQLASTEAALAMSKLQIQKLEAELKALAAREASVTPVEAAA